MRPKGCLEMFQDLLPVSELTAALEKSGVLDLLDAAVHDGSNVVKFDK